MIIEIRSGEGGQHAVELVRTQLSVYLKMCARRGL